MKQENLKTIQEAVQSVHFSAKTDEWSTPQNLFDDLHREFSFTLDPAASDENAKLSTYYTKEENGLTKNWKGHRVFCNPPYNRYSVKEWVKKLASGEADLTVALLPARTNTSWFHDYVWNKAEIRFIRGKLKFGGYKWQAPFPSMICIWLPTNQKKQTLCRKEIP